MTKRIHPIDRLVGQRVRILRIERGMSQTTLASSLDLTFQQLQKYEHGTNRISAGKLFQIAEALDVNVADLFDGAGDSNATSLNGMDGSTALSHADISIASTLSRIPASPMKKHLRALIALLAHDHDGL